MAKRKTPRSQYRQYQTQSRAARAENSVGSNRTWWIIGVLIIVALAIAVAWQFYQPKEEEIGIWPLAQISPTERANFSDSPPDMEIDTSRDYQARITTEKGEFTLDLFEQESPITVNNFVFLSRQGFYNGLTFHRVIDNFMAQGGDPTGDGGGGPGYRFEDETDNGLIFDRAGLLAMANAGPNTNGSQFFITFAPTPHLDGLHTIFGEVIDGAEVLDLITRRDPQSNPDYVGDLIGTIVILEDGQPS